MLCTRWIDFRLVPEGDRRTRFELEHLAHITDERWAEFGPGAAGVGWDMLFRSLGLHLSSGGQAVNPDEVAAWSASDEGQRFMTMSSQAWRDASIAAGTNPATAEAAPARTTAAYTGGG